MNFKELMQNRYATKKYDASKRIDKQKIEDLKEILRLTPSAINAQPWKFTFVSDVETKVKLAKVSNHNEHKILNCDTVVVFSRTNNLEKFEVEIKETLPQGAIDYYTNIIKTQPQEQIKTWFGKQVYLALGVFLTACASMEIDSTPMEGIVAKEYDKILNQTDYSTLVAVAIGYRDENDEFQLDKRPKIRKKLDDVIETI